MLETYCVNKASIHTYLFRGSDELSEFFWLTLLDFRPDAWQEYLNNMSIVIPWRTVNSSPRFWSSLILVHLQILRELEL